MSNVMVINMGLKSIRCILFDQNGLKLGSAAQAINTAINDKQVEQNPEEWIRKAKQVMSKALWDAGSPRIDFITATASASCLVCATKDGRSMGRSLMVSDKRAGQQSERIAAVPEFTRIREEAGLDSSASLMLPKILWVKENQPEVFSESDYFLTPNDYLIHFISGVFVTDCLNALKYHYDPIRKSYPEALLQALRIPSEKLPGVADIGERVGTMRKPLAEEIGINPDVQVVLTSYDAICSFIGSGVTEEGEASDVSGTVTVFRAFTRKKAEAAANGIYDIPFDLGENRIVGGSNNLGGGLIEWVKQCYYQKEEYPYEIMEKDAAESEPGARGLIFLPYLLGERVPIWDDNARGVFLGLERMHTRKDMTRAVFESTGFIDLDIIEAIQRAGVEVRSVRLSGGLARINLISKIKADILGRDVHVLSEFETTASGAAMIVLLSQGVYPDMKRTAEQFAKIRMIIKPDLENHRKYKYMYELYRDTYVTLKDLFQRRKDILQKIRTDREVQIENL